MLGYVSSAWRYRHFIATTVWIDFKGRFARSKVVAFWIVAQPLIQVAIYSLILSSVISSRLSNVANKFGYFIYLLAGILALSLFAELLGRSLNVFIDHEIILKKDVFPRF